MRVRVLGCVLGAVAVALLAGPIAPAAAKTAPTGCTVLSPADLQAILNAPFDAGTSAGQAYAAGDCRFPTAAGQPPATGSSGQVIVHVEAGKKAGAKWYASTDQMPLTGVTKVTGVGTAAKLSDGSGQVCAPSSAYRIDAKNGKGAVTVWASLVSARDAAGNCVSRVSPAQMSALADQVLAKL